MPVSPGASGMQPRDPCRPWRGTLASGHKPRRGLLALPSLESNPQLSFATRMEDWTCLGQHRRQPEFPVVTREFHRNSRKTTWLPRQRKMKPFPATAPQEKVPSLNVNVAVGFAPWPVPALVTVNRNRWSVPEIADTDAVEPQPAERATS